MEEVWKDVTGYEGFYKVSNYGRVKSVDREIISKNGDVRLLKGSIRKSSNNSKGYQHITLSKDNNQRTVFVHRLVAESFIPNPNKLPIVNHIDGDKSNNIVTNLEWVNNSQNIIHALEIGLNNSYHDNNDDILEKEPVITKKEKILNIYKENPNLPIKDIANTVSISSTYVSRVIKMYEDKEYESRIKKNKSKYRKKYKDRRVEKKREKELKTIDEFSLKSGFKYIDGYEGIYAVSKNGEVLRAPHYRDVYVQGEKRKYFYPEKMMSLTPNSRYPSINLNLDNEVENFLIHRLVAQAFIPNPENKPYVNHIDGDPHNNHVSNLEWVTQSENINHAIKIGNKKAKVEKRPATTTRQKIIDVLTVFPEMKTGKVAELVGCRPKYVTNVRHGWHD